MTWPHHFVTDDKKTHQVNEWRAKMPRIARMVVTGETAVYHVMSRTVLDGFVLGDVEKEYMLKLIKHLSSIYLLRF